MEPWIIALLSGFALCLGLILSIGAQNAIVLRQGLRREHVGIVVLACVVSDAVLQTIGVAGVATLVTAQPWLETVARWAGAVFIVGFALLSARRAWRGGGSLEAADDEPVEARAASAHGPVADGDAVARDGPLASHGNGSRASAASAVATRARRRGGPMATLLTILAVTWLNPHALVETTVVLGSVAGTHGDGRWWFLAGGIAASTLWFVGFGYGARYLAPLLRTERAWRILDGAIAVVMLVIAVTLVLG